jgi:hypothetical protein
MSFANNAVDGQPWNVQPGGNVSLSSRADVDQITSLVA